MPNSGTNCKVESSLIDGIEITSDNLTSRAGLALFSRYVGQLGIMSDVKRLFGSMRKSRKGLSVPRLFKQLLCFFLDGTSPHLVYFDRLKADRGYAAAIEALQEELASSHQVKRFFAAFSWVRIWKFRTLLQQLFLWRLKEEQPDVIELGLDTMVMDNTEAKVRHGVEPTYKKGVCGFKPLQLTWGPYVVDAVFRGGKKNCNHGDTAIKMLERIVHRIRTSYREDVPIIVRADSAFFDQKIFGRLEELHVWYLVAGRLYKSLKQLVRQLDEEAWQTYTNGRKEWAYTEIWASHKSWDRCRRTIYTYTWAENGQRLLPFDTEHVIYTNLGPSARFASERERELLAPYLETEGLIACYHGRGSDELVHRALKDFREETLPFKRFSMNAAFYYVALVAFFLFEAFKRDVTNDVLPEESYATRLRRTILDVAGKIVRHAHKITLKVTEAVWKDLDFQRLWQKANSPPPFAWS